MSKSRKYESLLVSLAGLPLSFCHLLARTEVKHRFEDLLGKKILWTILFTMFAVFSVLTLGVLPVVVVLFTAVLDVLRYVGHLSLLADQCEEQDRG